MATPVPIPQDATVGFDQPQSQATPMGAAGGSPANNAVPIPTDATVGYGDSQSQTKNAVPSLPEGQSEVGAALGTEPIKTSDIPVPKKNETKAEGYKRAMTLPMDWSGLKGIGSDLMAAAKGAVTGAVDMVKAPKDDTEKNIQMLGGPAALPIYRALLAAGHTVKEATEVIGAVKDIGQSDDPLGTLAKVLQKTSSQGAAQATLALATEGVLKAAPKVLGPAYQTAKGKLSPSTLQEPLQTGVRDIIADSTKSTPVEFAPKPNYVYRARDVGEIGIPKPHASSHGQAMTDMETAKTYAEPGNRGSVGGTGLREEVPQEVVRIDLNKLKPENYRSAANRAPVVEGADPVRGGEKYDFPNGLPEEHVERVTPELEKQEAAEAKAVEDEKAAVVNKKPSTSMRDVSHEAGDRIMAEAKSDYQVLDKESGGRFQRFRDKLEANRRALRDLTSSEEDVAKESRILKSQKEIEDEMGDMYEDLKKKGINPDLIDRADRNFRRAQGAYDVGDAIRKNTTGAHPDISHPDLVKELPETLDPKGFHKTINRLYDSGRLQDFLGEEGANKMFDLSLEHAGALTKIMRNRKYALIGGAIGASAAGGGGYVAHKFGSAALGQ